MQTQGAILVPAQPMLSELLLTEIHRLDPNSTLPLHRQLHEVLRRTLLNGKLQAGERLASSRSRQGGFVSKHNGGLIFQEISMTPISDSVTTRTTPGGALTRRHLTLAALCLGLSVVAGGSQAASDDSVTLDTARAAHEAGRVTLIDIREPNEHATGVAKGAKLLPMSQIDARLGEIPSTTDKPVLLICNTQNRSSKTLAALRQQGFKNVRFVEGGMSEWNRRGWPVVKP